MFAKLYDAEGMVTAFQVQTITEHKDHFVIAGTDRSFIFKNYGGIESKNDSDFLPSFQKWEYFMYDKESYTDDPESYKAFEKVMRYL